MTKQVRGATVLPNQALPVLSTAGQSLLATDAAGVLNKSSNGGPYVPVGSGASVASPVSIEQLVNFSTPVVSPIYATLFTLPITTLLPASFVWFCFTASWSHNGPFAGNVAANFRFRLNGGVLVGGCTDNMTRAQIGTVARNGRAPVVAGVQTLVCECTHFAGPLNTLDISVATNPDLWHAALTMEEQPP